MKRLQPKKQHTEFDKPVFFSKYLPVKWICIIAQQAQYEHRHDMPFKAISSMMWHKRVNNPPIYEDHPIKKNKKFVKIPGMQLWLEQKPAYRGASGTSFGNSGLVYVYLLQHLISFQK